MSSPRDVASRSLALAILLLLVAATPAGALSLRIVPGLEASRPVLPGSVIPVSLVLADLGDDGALGSFDLAIAIDGEALSLGAVRLGELGSSDAQLFALDALADGFRLRWVSLASPEHLNAEQATTFAIARFEVEAERPGVALLWFTSVSLGDSAGAALRVDASDTARITVVPEASTTALVAVGLAALSARCAGRRCF